MFHRIPYDMSYMQTCKWSAWLNSILTLNTNIVYKLLYTASIRKPICGWTGVFKIQARMRPLAFITFVHRHQENACYATICNCSRLHFCKVLVVIIAYHKIVAVNPPLKLSSNEPMQHDWTKIRVNNILSHQWKVFWRKIIFASKSWWQSDVLHPVYHSTVS